VKSWLHELQNLDVSLFSPETIQLPAWLIRRSRLLRSPILDEVRNLDFTSERTKSSPWTNKFITGKNGMKKAAASGDAAAPFPVARELAGSSVSPDRRRRPG
jgi:hypothetical protein